MKNKVVEVLENQIIFHIFVGGNVFFCIFVKQNQRHYDNYKQK